LEPILSVRNLSTWFYMEEGVVKAVNDVNFDLHENEVVGIVGETGSGKSVTVRSIMRLIHKPGKIVSGKIIYRGRGKEEDILSLPDDEMTKIRGKEISMVFQDPLTSLNPLYTVGSQIMEAINLHQDIDKKMARKKAIDILDKVGISAPKKRVDEYPHQLSGGMRQRVMIAMALSCDPNFLIADEPTTALDVTIEAQILNLMRELQSEFNMSIMIITHDLGVIGEMADRVIVMYTGKVVEKATTDDIFYNPKHPYTKGLLKSIPKIGIKGRLAPIKGSVPNLLMLPEGCYFEPRCEYAKKS